MKKIIYILLIAFISFSCKDFNVDEDWVDDAERPGNLTQYEYTMTDADYGIIVTALKATGTEENTALANKLNSAKKFTPELKPADLIPYLLEKKYYSADVKSSAKITYMYDDARDEVLGGLTGNGYIVADEDYKAAWGNVYTNSFNPEKKPEAYIPNILKTKYSSAANGSYITVEYNYSDDNSVPANVENRFFYEDFETFEANEENIPGWINKDVINTRKWSVRYYAAANNKYMQMQGSSSQNNDGWLITKKIDLPASANDPKFLFDITVGYWKATNLSILISTDFDGTEDNILSATWTDVSSSFTIPTEPTGGYGTMGPAGAMTMNAYKGKSFYIAYRYQSTAGITSTYQVDKVNVAEIIPGIDVPNKAPRYATYKLTDGEWKKLSDNNIITLQPDDYAKLNLSSGTMTTAQAQTILPQYLSQNVIGTEKVVVYRTKAGEYYADRFKYESGQWIIQTTLEERSAQFLRSEKGWIFDPTFIISATKEDYMLVVTYVQDNLVSASNPNLINATYKDSEYYYGFSANYRNITYREKDRLYDTTYPATGTDAEKVTFMNQRTKDGLAILLALKYPDAQPKVSGVDQFAEFRTLTIYSEPGITQANVYWDYTFQCVGDKEWKFISRTASDGRSETAE